HAVDDRSMVQFVRDDRVLFSEQWFKDAAIGIKGSGIQNGIFHSQKGGKLLLQLFVDLLGATDKAYAAHTIPPLIKGALRSFPYAGMGREAQIVVGTEIQHFPAGYRYLRALRGADDPFVLE